MKKMSLANILGKCFYALLFLGIFTACTDDKPGDVETNTQKENEQIVQYQIETQTVSDGISGILEEIYAFEDFSLEAKGVVEKSDNILSCAIINSSLEGTTKRIVVDFGEGCQNQFGDILSGKVITHITLDPTTMTASAKHGFDNFKFNNHLVEGLVDVKRIRFNSYGNPQLDILRNLKITYGNGYVLLVEANHVKEWIEGYPTRESNDDAFLLTGSWKITHPSGTVQTGSIKLPLRKESDCTYVVKGSVEIIHKNTNILLDFGDGTCDDLATLEIKGKLFEFKLRRAM